LNKQEDRNDHSRVMEQSLKRMEESKEDQAQTKLENLYAMFPHVACAEVRDIFEGVNKNI